MLKSYCPYVSMICNPESKSGKKSSSQKYYWRPPFNRSTIGDHLSTELLLETTFHGIPTRDVCLIEDLNLFIGDPKILIGNPPDFD